MSVNPPPNDPSNPIFNPSNWINTPSTQGITQTEADLLYLQKSGSSASGLINFNGGLSTSITGTATFNAPVLNNSVMPAFTNSSNIVPTTAWVQGAVSTSGGSYASLIANNTYSGTQTFNNNVSVNNSTLKVNKLNECFRIEYTDNLSNARPLTFSSPSVNNDPNAPFIIATNNAMTFKVDTTDCYKITDSGLNIMTTRLALGKDANPSVPLDVSGNVLITSNTSNAFKLTNSVTGDLINVNSATPTINLGNVTTPLNSFNSFANQNIIKQVTRNGIAFAIQDNATSATPLQVNMSGNELRLGYQTSLFSNELWTNVTYGKLIAKNGTNNEICNFDGSNNIITLGSNSVSVPITINGTSALTINNPTTINGICDFNNSITCRAITQDANFNLNQSGTGIISQTGTGTNILKDTTFNGLVDINNTLTTRDITLDTNYNINMTGNSGILQQSSCINTFGNATFNSAVDINANLTTRGIQLDTGFNLTLNQGLILQNTGGVGNNSFWDSNFLGNVTEQVTPPFPNDLAYDPKSVVNADWVVQYVASQLALYASVQTGSIQSFASTTSPSGYLLCNGQSVSTTTYSALFNKIGYIYGGSGGSFNVPNLVGKYIQGSTTNANTQTGNNSITLSASQIPQLTKSNVYPTSVVLNSASGGWSYLKGALAGDSSQSFYTPRTSDNINSIINLTDAFNVGSPTPSTVTITPSSILFQYWIKT